MEIIFFIILSIIGLVFFMLYLICRPKYKMFTKPRSFESEFSLLEKDHYTFLVKRVMDKNHVMAKYIGYGDIYAVINRPYFDMATVRFENPIIIGRCYYDDKWLPIITEENLWMKMN